MATVLNIKTQGRSSVYPSRKRVIDALLLGEKPWLYFSKDEDGQIILIDYGTNMPAGCVPPNPSCVEEYSLIKNCLENGVVLDVQAVKACPHHRHFHVQVIIPE